MDIEDIYQASKTGFGGHTPRVSINLAKQKSDYLCGSLLLFTAFSSQLVNSFGLTPLKKQATKSISHGVALSLLVFVLLVIATYVLQVQYLSRQKRQLQEKGINLQSIS